MPFQSSARRLPCILAIASIAAGPMGARSAAQTRQVSVESLVYDLKNPDALRRQAAARALGAARQRSATPDLVALAHDPVDAVRREVELSLELMEDIRALPGFIAFATDLQNDIRGRAVASIVALHLPRAGGLTSTLTKLGELMMLAPDRDLEMIVEPDIPIDPSVVPTLRSRLADSQRGIRRTAIRGLGILRAQAAVPDLLQVVSEDRDDALRFDGVRALRKIGDGSIANQLLALLNINTDLVRNELIATLGSMRYHGAVPELTRIVEQAKRPDTPCIAALAALADIADPASVPLFERLKADRSEALRLYANEGIARTTDANQRAAISAARLIERSPRVRLAQAFALLRVGEREYLDELVRGLEYSTTRTLAREYLLETPPADREALFAPRPVRAAVRANLADVLGLMGDPNALPRLQELARDSDEDVVRAAERASRRLALVTSSQD